MSSILIPLSLFTFIIGVLHELLEFLLAVCEATSTSLVDAMPAIFDIMTAKEIKYFAIGFVAGVGFAIGLFI